MWSEFKQAALWKSRNLSIAPLLGMGGSLRNWETVLGSHLLRRRDYPEIPLGTRLPLTLSCLIICRLSPSVSVSAAATTTN